MENAEAYTRRAITNTAISWRRRKSWHERPTETLPDRADRECHVGQARAPATARPGRRRPPRRGRLTTGLAAGSPRAFAERRVGYALGDVVHWGSDSFSVGAVVVSYVRTDDGFVYTTKDGTVWLFDGAASQAIGHAANHGRTDDRGSLVAWVDSAEDGHPQYTAPRTGTPSTSCSPRTP